MTKAKQGHKSVRKGRRFARAGRNLSTASILSPASAPPDLLVIMDHFAQALSLVIVCHRSLAAQPSAGVGDEEETLKRAIRLLKDVYNEIDLASMVTMRTSQ